MATRKTRSSKGGTTPSDMRIRFYQPKPKKAVSLGDSTMESTLLQLQGEDGAMNDQEHEEGDEEVLQDEEENVDAMHVDPELHADDDQEHEENEYADADADADVDADGDEDNDEEAGDTTMGDIRTSSADTSNNRNHISNNVYNFPTNIFSDRKSCLAAANDVAASHGFALSTHKSSQKRAVVICSRGGMPNARGPNEVVLRRTKSLKCDCPFRIAIRSRVIYGQNPNTGERTKGTGHYISVEDPNHNHPLLTGAELAAIPKMRRLTNEQMEFVRTLEREGKPPPQIYNMLKFKWPDCLANSKDVRNAINKIHRESSATDLVIGGEASSETPAPATSTAQPTPANVNLTGASPTTHPAPTTTATTATPNPTTPTVQRWRLGKRPLENGTPGSTPSSSQQQPPATRPRLDPVEASDLLSGSSFPTVESLPAPSELFRRHMPYILTVHGDLNPARNSIKITCSHEPTLSLIAKYFQSHARVSKNSDTPVVKVELVPSFLNAGQDGGTLYDGLIIKPTMAGAPLNPSTVVCFVEAVLKYTCVGVSSKELFWQFKREVPAE